MPRPGFYNDNEYRAYPLVYRPDYFGDNLPSSAIVDAGIIMGLQSAFNAAEHAVWLASVALSGDTVSFTFATDAPGAAGASLIFNCPVTADPWTTLFSEATAADDCQGAPLWEGFLVVGPLTELLELLGENPSLSFAGSERALEPGRIQSLVRGYVSSVNLGNFPRIRVLPTEECQESSEAVDEDIVVNATCMQGDLRFKEGFNCRIKQTDRDNEIRVFAEKGAGDTTSTELCDHGSELALYPEEPFDAETGFFSGGPSCDQTISTINGFSGTNITITAGTGITVTTDAATHTVTIALATNNNVGNCS